MDCFTHLRFTYFTEYPSQAETVRLSTISQALTKRRNNIINYHFGRLRILKNVKSPSSSKLHPCLVAGHARLASTHHAFCIFHLPYRPRKVDCTQGNGCRLAQKEWLPLSHDSGRLFSCSFFLFISTIIIWQCGEAHLFDSKMSLNSS